MLICYINVRSQQGTHNKDRSGRQINGLAVRRTHAGLFDYYTSMQMSLKAIKMILTRSWLRRNKLFQTGLFKRD